MSVAGVVVDGDKALLVQRRDNAHWEPPGGVLEVAETITDGLVREVREETGLTVEPIALTGVYKNMTRGIVALVFRCRSVAGNLLTNDEVKSFHWATKDEVTAMLDEAYAVRVLDAMQAEHPKIRHHDGVNLLG
ncbi:NUDIX hydrolase [Actinomadura macrotermitis]|uniref:NUDIX hydrolase n=1 Tax=Actinomadura macrotermitis TaxID=2585200 RepID=UPI002E26B576